MCLAHASLCGPPAPCCAAPCLQEVLSQWCTEFISSMGLDPNGNANEVYSEIPADDGITNLQQCMTEQASPACVAPHARARARICGWVGGE